MKDDGDGTYTLEYRALPGEWKLEVLCNGRHVSPTPCSIVNAADPAESEERRAREAAERERQLKEAAEAEAARVAAEAAEAEKAAESARRKLEVELVAQAKREDEKMRRAEEVASRLAAQAAEKRRRVMANLRREEETRRRAQEALEEVQRERERQAAEAVARRASFSKRTGGGFVVHFKPKVDNYVGEAEEVHSASAGGKSTERRGGSRRLELSEPVEEM